MSTDFTDALDPIHNTMEYTNVSQKPHLAYTMKQILHARVELDDATSLEGLKDHVQNVLKKNDIVNVNIISQKELSH